MYMAHPRIHIFVMARGQGLRLRPLTTLRSKPATPFGNGHRLIDFALSNIQSIDAYNVTILGPSKRDCPELLSHVSTKWSQVHYKPMIEASEKIGNAESIRRALLSSDMNETDIVGVLPSDQLLYVDLNETLTRHIQSKSEASLLSMWYPVNKSKHLGVLQQKHGCVVEYLEKPSSLPDSFIVENHCLVNMGIYWFNTSFLRTVLNDQGHSSQDFGQDVLPTLVSRRDLHCIQLPNNTPWQDLGTIEAYWQAHWNHQPHQSSIWKIKQTLKTVVHTNTLYTQSPIPESVQTHKTIIHKNVSVGEHATLNQVLLDDGCIVEPHTRLSTDSNIKGYVYRTKDCIIVPTRSRVFQQRNSNTVIVEPL